LASSISFEDGKGFTQIILWQTLHANQQPATATSAARPSFNFPVDLFPSTQVEVSNTEISPIGERQCLSECWEK
jgi:hypothetical protein